MIKNDKQLSHAEKRLGELSTKILELRQEYSGVLRDLHTTPLQNSVNKLEAQISEYKELINSSFSDAVDGVLKKPHSIEEIAQLLSKLRIAAGLTQTEMAEKLGWEQSNLSRFESDRYSGQTLSKIAEYADALEIWLYIVPELDELPSRIKYKKEIELDRGPKSWHFELEQLFKHHKPQMITTSAKDPFQFSKEFESLEVDNVDEHDLVLT